MIQVDEKIIASLLHLRSQAPGDFEAMITWLKHHQVRLAITSCKQSTNPQSQWLQGAVQLLEELNDTLSKLDECKERLSKKPSQLGVRAHT